MPRRKSAGTELKSFVMKIHTPFTLWLGLALALYSLPLSAQTRPGSLRGTVTEHKTQETVPFANVVLKTYDGVIRAGGTTDFDGKYNINPVKPGIYRAEVTFTGYAKVILDSLLISPNAPTLQDFVLREEAEMLQEVVLMYQAPLIDKTKNSKVTTAEDIQNMAVRDISSISAQSPSVISHHSSGEVANATAVRGARSDAQVYFIDGVKVRGSVAIPQAAIAQTEVITGGTPAYVPSAELDLKPAVEGDHHLPPAKTTYEYRRETRSWHVVPLPERQKPEERFAGENYKHIPENEFLGTYYEPLSTFGADVDVASYANVRRMLKDGYWPHPDAVRLEELINYFSYDLNEPEDGSPFGLTVDQRVCDWNKKHQLLRVGLRTETKAAEELPPSNLVFLIDVSGSMHSANKLPLLKNALRILVKNLKDEDRVAIVVYASASGLVLESTPASNSRKILEAIDQLSAGGSTAGGAGIKLAYKTARKHFEPEFNNRVILATDGDFNVGVSSEQGLIELIEEEREHGIFLSVLGFGDGNYQDAKMEQLADHGNGNYAYIDGLMEARKVLAEEMGANLHVVAKDTKFQIEFNPHKVSAYRLIGYENRLLAAEDFDDDTKDAGDIGAGHSVTALYEIIPRIAADDELWTEEPQLRYQDKNLSKEAYGEEIAQLKIRYKDPQGSKSKLSIHPIQTKMSDDVDFAFLSAVVQYGLILRQSEFAGSASLEAAIALAKDNLGDDPHGYRREFVKLCKLARDLEPEKGVASLD